MGDGERCGDGERGDEDLCGRGDGGKSLNERFLLSVRYSSE